MSIVDFLPGWVVNDELVHKFVACIISLLGIPLFFSCFFVFATFFAAPCMYFAIRQQNYRAEKLNEKYREEALRLRGVVQKRWTTTSTANDGTTTHYHVQVTYNIHQEEYIKEFLVSPTAYLQTEADLMVLPMYPRSAILALEN